MTCIAGIINKKKNIVLIGADSAGVSGYDVTVRIDPKVFRVGDFIIGCTSSFRMIQLIRFSFKPPKRYDDQEIFEYMCTSFINELRSIFKSGGFINIENSTERGGTFLVGYKGRLFTIFDDFQVAEPIKGYDSVGCGSSFALGAFDAMDYDELDERDRITRALSIAEYRSGGVRSPFLILEEKC